MEQLIGAVPCMNCKERNIRSRNYILHCTGRWILSAFLTSMVMRFKNFIRYLNAIFPGPSLTVLVRFGLKYKMVLNAKPVNPVSKKPLFQDSGSRLLPQSPLVLEAI